MPFSLYRVSKSRYYVIHNESGAKHSSKPLTYLNAKAQLRALNALYHNEPLHPLDVRGGSFFDSLNLVLRTCMDVLKDLLLAID